MHPLFKDSRTIERLHRGLLSEHLDSYAALLSQCDHDLSPSLTTAPQRNRESSGLAQAER